MIFLLPHAPCFSFWLIHIYLFSLPSRVKKFSCTTLTDHSVPNLCLLMLLNHNFLGQFSTKTNAMILRCQIRYLRNISMVDFAKWNKQQFLINDHKKGAYGELLFPTAAKIGYDNGAINSFCVRTIRKNCVHKRQRRFPWGKYTRQTQCIIFAQCVDNKKASLDFAAKVLMTTYIIQ